MYQPRVPLKTRAALLLEVHPIGRLLDVAQLILSFISVALYVIGTYGYHEDGWYIYLDSAITMYFLVYYMLHFAVASNPIRFFFNLQSLIDLVTILPILTLVVANTSFLRILVIFKCLRILRTFRIFDYLPGRSEVFKQIFRLLFVLAVLIFIGTGVVQILDDISYERALYFIVITVSTVGYGDETPDNPYSKAAIVVFVLISMILVPTLVASLGTLLSLRHKKAYGGDFYLHGAAHVIVTGHMSDDTIINFITNFYHRGRPRHATKMVILRPSKPSQRLKRVLTKSDVSPFIYYHRGSPLRIVDLKKAKARLAKGCFIFADTRNGKESQDRVTILTAVLMHSANPNMRIFANLIRPRSAADLPVAVEAFCLDEMKMSLLAKSYMCPGILAFISNLAQKTSPIIPTDSSTLHSMKKSIIYAWKYLLSEDEVVKMRKLDQMKWLRQYDWGRSQEVYHIPVPKPYVSMSVAEASTHAYQRHGIGIFGVMSTRGGRKGAERNAQKNIEVHPSPNRILRPGDEIFVIAQSFSSLSPLLPGRLRSWYMSMCRALRPNTWKRHTKRNKRGSGAQPSGGIGEVDGVDDGIDDGIEDGVIDDGIDDGVIDGVIDGIIDDGVDDGVIDDGVDDGVIDGADTHPPHHETYSSSSPSTDSLMDPSHGTPMRLLGVGGMRSTSRGASGVCAVQPRGGRSTLGLSTRVMHSLGSTTGPSQLWMASCGIVGGAHADVCATPGRRDDVHRSVERLRDALGPASGGVSGGEVSGGGDVDLWNDVVLLAREIERLRDVLKHQRHARGGGEEVKKEHRQEEKDIQIVVVDDDEEEEDDDEEDDDGEDEEDDDDGEEDDYDDEDHIHEDDYIDGDVHNVSSWNDHVIVCGPLPSAGMVLSTLHSLWWPMMMRTHHHKKKEEEMMKGEEEEMSSSITPPPVVFLTPALPSWLRRAGKTFSQKVNAINRNVCIIEGDASSLRHLDRVNASMAKLIVLLEHPMEKHTEDDGCADATQITTYFLLRRHYGCNGGGDGPFVVLSLSSATSLKFLRPSMMPMGAIERPGGPYAVPSFAEGRVYSNSVLENLMCQAYFDGVLPRVMEAFVFGCWMDDVCHAGVQLMSMEHVVPMQLVHSGLTCGELYERIRPLGKTFLGLYRRTSSTHRGGAHTRHHGTKYVYTMPPPSTMVHESDMVFLIQRSRKGR